MAKKPTYEELEQKITELANEAVEHKMAEEELEESEQLQKSIIQLSPDMIFRFDRDAIYTYFKAPTDFSTHIPENPIGKSAHHFMPKNIVDERMKLAQQIWETGKPIEHEYHFMVDDEKRYRWAKYIRWSDDEILAAVRDISARKQAEEILKRSEEKFAKAFHHGPTLMTINSIQDGKYIEVNENFVRVTGYSREESIGTTSADLGFISEEDRDELEQELIKNGRVDGMELALNKKNGDTLYCQYFGEIITIDGEKRLLSIASDITDRKQAEEALRESENNLKQAQKVSHVGSWDLDVVTGTLYWSDETYRIYGFKPHEFVPTYEKFQAILHPEDHERVQKAVAAALSGATDYDIDFRFMRPDGQTGWIHCDGQVTHDGEGKPIRFFGTQIDITERKQAEEALRENEAKYRRVSDNSPAVLYQFIMTPDGAFSFPYVSDAIVSIMGIPPEDVMKDPSKLLGMVHPEDQEMFREGIMKSAESLESFPLTFRCMKDGEVIWIEARGMPTPLTEGGMLWDGFLLDITERKQMEEELLKAKKLESLGVLAGGVAHEFNNALMGVMGNIELLKMDLPEDERRDRYFEAMKDSSHRMSHLTDQLLAYAQGGKYQPKDLKLDDFVIQTLPILQHDLSPAVRLETHFSKDIPHIKADYAQMQMVLSAILANSNEAIEEEGLIRITAENEDLDEDFTKQYPGLKPGSYVCLTIEDDGKGMDEETKDGIFEPFFTTKFQGRGMGMAAVYGIVKNHDGRIYVESELGKGTTVRIYLPATEIEVEEPKKAEVEVIRGSGTILMIEDEDVVIEVTQAMLERLGYRVMVAKTGKDAIHITETFNGQIDLALLDIKLPDMEGGKVYPLIMEARPDLKVIVFSGYAIEGPARKILDAGAQDFIQKPFSLATLSEKLTEVLEL